MDFPLAPITIQQMITFIQVTEHGGFAKASGYLNMTQSAVSKSIAKLEKELGISLFQRTTREIHLTEAGRILYESWNHELKELRNSYAQALSLQNINNKQLRIGILNTARPELYFWQLQDAFHKNHPEINIELQSAYMADLISDLSDGKYDLIMVPDFQRFLLAEKDLCWKWAACGNVQVLMNRNHPLSKQSSLKMTDILYEKFVTLLLSSDQTHRMDIEERFDRYHVKPNFVDTYKSAYDIKLLFRQHDDALLLTDEYFDCPNDPIMIKVPLTDQTNGIICAWNPHSVNTATQLFLDELKPVNHQ